MGDLDETKTIVSHLDERDETVALSEKELEGELNFNDLRVGQKASVWTSGSEYVFERTRKGLELSKNAISLGSVEFVFSAHNSNLMTSGLIKFSRKKSSDRIRTGEIMVYKLKIGEIPQRTSPISNWQRVD